MFVIARAINGISINGDEYLLDAEGEVRKFSYEDAVSLCVEHNISLDCITDINDL